MGGPTGLVQMSNKCRVRVGSPTYPRRRRSPPGKNFNLVTVMCKNVTGTENFTLVH